MYVPDCAKPVTSSAETTDLSIAQDFLEENTEDLSVASVVSPGLKNKLHF
jgi:hypothetical protein